MMNQQQPDNLFREKLQYYQKPAPAGAWNRIESALEKKTKRDFLWWKIAASLLLVAGGAYLFWFQNLPVEQRPLARTEKQSTDALQSVEPTIPEKPVENQSQHMKKESKAGSTADNLGKKRMPATTKEEVIKLSTITNEPMTVAMEPDFKETLAIDPVTPTVEKPHDTVTKSTITLTISSEEADQYLNKSAFAEATSSEKKPSTLKKFLKKANDLKSNQDPFGDLRERKNEILALNFKSDKREQNK